MEPRKRKKKTRQKMGARDARTLHRSPPFLDENKTDFVFQFNVADEYLK
jgi:hypothetical protein